MRQSREFTFSCMSSTYVCTISLRHNHKLEQENYYGDSHTSDHPHPTHTPHTPHSSLKRFQRNMHHQELSTSFIVFLREAKNLDFQMTTSQNKQFFSHLENKFENIRLRYLIYYNLHSTTYKTQFLMIEQVFSPPEKWKI